MTELNFKGKEFVYNHHLAIPFRPLVPQADKGIGEVALDGNLIIQGDNLNALKSLLPMYAGKVDCIFIDPPYNTGNEGWAYNDNVRAPMIQEWLGQTVGLDDGLRHDKWCAMMWPRLRLLHELLSENGSLWITLDDNEVHRAKLMLDEIFGNQNFIVNAVWHKNYAPKSSAKYFSEDHDNLLVYAKSKIDWRPNHLPRTDEQNSLYKNLDNDPRGSWRPNNFAARNFYSKGTYPIICPGGRQIQGPPKGLYWRSSHETLQKLDADNRIWWGEDGNNVPAPKIFLSEVMDGRVPQSYLHWSEVGHTQEAKRELLDLFDFSDSEEVFITPKPKRLIKHILKIASHENSIVLDSFAGSGTTANAVLEANKRDGGNRKFIMVEMEDYADRLTAERVRRVMKGYEFSGTQKTELLREKLSWSKFEKAEALTKKVQSIENLEGQSYDKVTKSVKNDHLVVTGEKNVKEKTKGLGGTFTYCTLGDPVALDKVLSGKSLPSFEGIGSALFHMATSRAIDPSKINQDTFYLGETENEVVWLIYKDDLDWLKSADAALTLQRAKDFAATDPKRKHLVLAATRFVSQKMLQDNQLNVEFVPLPFALYRIDRT